MKNDIDLETGNSGVVKPSLTVSDDLRESVRARFTNGQWVEEVKDQVTYVKWQPGKPSDPV
jgi:hypothetical protein